MGLQLSEKIINTYKIPQVEDISLTFPTNPRKPPWAKRRMDEIKYLVIHHSASTGTLQAENNYHVNNNNWYRISYHFSIDRGHIYQLNDILDVTAHAMGANQNGIGICVNWDLRLRPLTDFERNALYGLLGTLMDMFPNAEIVGHNEISKRLANHATSCPIIDMNKFRSDFMTDQLNNELDATPNDTNAKVFSAYTRFTDLYNVAIKPGKFQAEAQRKIMTIAKAMEDAKILVTPTP